MLSKKTNRGHLGRFLMVADFRNNAINKKFIIIK